MKKERVEGSVGNGFYENLESMYKVTYPKIDNATYFNIANYTPDLDKPIQRWYRYKEGYSLELNENIFREFSVGKRDIICDPFCGGGSTLLCSFLNDLKSVGFEVNPFAALLAKVKTRYYSDQEIKELDKQIKNINGVVPDGNLTTKPKLSFIDKVFDGEVLELLLSYKEYISSIDDEKIRDLMFLAWLSILEDLSNYRKAGNGLKRKTRKNGNNLLGKKESTRHLLNTKLKLMHRDIQNYYGKVKKEYEPHIHNNSCLEMGKYLEEESLKGVIFSPPYANCFDYAEIYKIELWMGGFVREYSDLKELRKAALRSHLSATANGTISGGINLDELNELLGMLSKKDLWDKRIPAMLNGYFEDMSTVINDTYKCLKPGGFCCVVVSNSAYGGVVIPTDLLISRIAENAGFENLKIDVSRYIITSSQQYKQTQDQKKYLRESIVYLRK
jgi:DNA modification methylase